MPIAKGTLTSEIVKNIKSKLVKYNQYYSKTYVKQYNDYIEKREVLLKNHEYNYSNLMNDLGFIDEVQKILSNFGMNSRNSQLVEQKQFQNTLLQTASYFNSLRSSEVKLNSLNLGQKIGTQTVDIIIRKIFNLFSKPNHLSKSGGFVVASKTMHFVYPELFIMLDGKHIGISLSNITRSDYAPLTKDGKSWSDLIKNYSNKKPNPSPRGAGRENWDSERYLIALLYYKRIIHEWCLQNKTTFEDFLSIDSENYSKASRIIDKALW